MGIGGNISSRLVNHINNDYFEFFTQQPLPDAEQNKLLLHHHGHGHAAAPSSDLSNSDLPSFLTPTSSDTATTSSTKSPAEIAAQILGSNFSQED